MNHYLLSHLKDIGHSDSFRNSFTDTHGSTRQESGGDGKVKQEVEGGHDLPCFIIL